MSRPPDIIELEPKQPFSWKIVVCLLVTWLAVLALAFYLKARIIFLLLPLIAVIILGYIVVGTILFLKNRR